MAVGLPGGAVEATETARLRFDAGAIVLPGVEPGLVDAALEALHAAAGREGRWLDGRVTLEAGPGGVLPALMRKAVAEP